MLRIRSLAIPALVALLAPAVPATPLSAQDEEPILEQARSVFSQPGMRLRFLVRINADAGFETADLRFTPFQARARIDGELDGGFGYLLQTNFAASNVLLDARVGWRHSPSFYVWVGRFKPFYSEEFISYIRDIDFVFRSRVINDIGPNRQTGVQVGGQLTDFVSWSSGVFTGRQLTGGIGEPIVGIARLKAEGIEVGDGTLLVAVQGAIGQDEAIAPFQTGTPSAYLGEGDLIGVEARFESGPLMLHGELHRGSYRPDAGLDRDAIGHHLSAGWMTNDETQLLARWDRYRNPFQTEPNDYMVLGLNAWPTGAATFQVNWMIPLQDALIHRLLFTFQMAN